jgi:hypothetical protein
MTVTPLKTLDPESPSSPTREFTPGKIYHAGTLRYTLQGLIILSLWLRWGDFAFSFFESIFSRFLPLYLKDLHAYKNSRSP